MIPSLPWVKLGALAIAGLLVFLAWRWFAGIVEENATLRTNVTVLEGAVSAERALRAAVEADKARAEEIAARDRKEAADRLLQAAKARKDIQNVAPVAQGCEPVNPGARYGLNWVLSATQGGGGAGTGAGEAPAGAAPLRPVSGP